MDKTDGQKGREQGQPSGPGFPYWGLLLGIVTARYSSGLERQTASLTPHTAQEP